MQLLVLSYVSIEVPLRIGFDLNAYGFFLYLQILYDLYFTVDIVINFLSVRHRVAGLSCFHSHFFLTFKTLLIIVADMASPPLFTPTVSLIFQDPLPPVDVFV